MNAKFTSYAEHQEQTVFELHGFLCVPHYTKSGIYVMPGFGNPIVNPYSQPPTQQHEYTEKELLDMGAVEMTYPLWPRGK